MSKELEYEFVNNNSGKSIGTVWWNPDKERIEGSSVRVMHMLQDGHSGAGDLDKQFIKNLQNYFRSSYVSVKRKK